MNEPTQEQWEKLLRWCGLHYYPDCECIRVKGICWGESEETYGKNGHWHFVLPPLDLNNLFLHAVPIAIKIIMANQECDEELASAILFKKWLQIGYDATALFWASDKVRESER